ncbi:hypothetical protein V8C42DRAFT_330740 [Trichoderma barbatum]
MNLFSLLLLWFSSTGWSLELQHVQCLPYTSQHQIQKNTPLTNHVHITQQINHLNPATPSTTVLSPSSPIPIRYPKKEAPPQHIPASNQPPKELLPSHSSLSVSAL